MKVVRFNEEANRVHILHDYPVESEEARKSYWMHRRADDERFKRRIEQQAKVFDRILDSEHREKIILFIMKCNERI